VDSVFIEPIVNVNFEVDMVAEISWACVCYKELGAIADEMTFMQLFICTLIILANQTEIADQNISQGARGVVLHELGQLILNHFLGACCLKELDFEYKI